MFHIHIVFFVISFSIQEAIDGKKKTVLHGKLGYGGKESNDKKEVIIIPIAIANPLSDFDFIVESLELTGADRERSM